MSRKLKEECLEEWFFYLKLSNKQQRKITLENKENINCNYFKEQIEKHKKTYKQPKEIKLTRYE